MSEPIVFAWLGQELSDATENAVIARYDHLDPLFPKRRWARLLVWLMRWADPVRPSSS